jgi:hypothetical protein
MSTGLKCLPRPHIRLEVVDIQDFAGALGIGGQLSARNPRPVDVLVERAEVDGTVVGRAFNRNLQVLPHVVVPDFDRLRVPVTPAILGAVELLQLGDNLGLPICVNAFLQVVDMPPACGPSGCGGRARCCGLAGIPVIDQIGHLLAVGEHFPLCQRGAHAHQRLASWVGLHRAEEFGLLVPVDHVRGRVEEFFFRLFQVRLGRELSVSRPHATHGVEVPDGTRCRTA